MNNAHLLASDFPEGSKLLASGERLFIRYPNPNASFFSIRSLDTICITSHAKSAEQITEENLNRMLPRLGFGLAGAALFGSIGALAGLLGAGRRTEVCFACELDDGRKVMGTCGLRAWHGLKAAVLKRSFAAGIGSAPSVEVPPA